MLKTIATYISVDVETAGPNSSTCSLLSIGACTIFELLKTLYVEIQPVDENKNPDATVITGGLSWVKRRRRIRGGSRQCRGMWDR